MTKFDNVGLIRIPGEYMGALITNRLVFKLPEGMELVRFFKDEMHDELVLVMRFSLFSPRAIGTAMPNYLVSFADIGDGSYEMTLNMGGK